jgi:predicted O-methyltransferase YrrM
MRVSDEQLMPTERLSKNLQPLDGYFGPFFQLMRESLATGGSELGLPMTLFSLAVSIRAASIVEIGRFKGLSTLALASALRFIEIGWEEPAHNKQRPDVDYLAHEGPRQRRVVSIDPFPTQEAADLITRAGLTDLVAFVNHRSQDVQVTGQIDLLFIDGDHSYEGCLGDVMKYVPAVRPGGYFILHDYYGWYEGDGLNKSPIKRVIDQVPADFQRLLIDTGYQSFVIFQRPPSHGQAARRGSSE